MKVVVSIVNTLTGRSQYGVIDEPIKKGSEVKNALAHFGITEYTVDTAVDHVGTTMISGHVLMSNNYFTLICYEVQKEVSMAEGPAVKMGQSPTEC